MINRNVGLSGKVVFAIILMLLLSVFVLTFDVQPIKGWVGTVFIRADGSIDPPSAPIKTYDKITYTLTDNITSSTDAIVVERDNIVIDGAGYKLQGSGAYLTKGIDLSRRSNVTFKNIRIEGFSYGVWLYISSNNRIIENNIKLCNNEGVSIGGYSSDNIIAKNIITDNEEGIGVGFSSSNMICANNVTGNFRGIGVADGSHNNNISENSITNNGWFGIWIGASNNSIFGNNITNNYFGIWILTSSYSSIARNNLRSNNYGVNLDSYSNNNEIVENNITDNEFGIYFYRSSKNLIYYNNFDNEVNAYSETPGYANNWDNDYPNGGNYWSNYEGFDANNDLIGDTPYTVNADNKDDYPLMIPWGCRIAYNTNTTITKLRVTEIAIYFDTLGPDGTVAYINMTLPINFNNTAFMIFLEDEEITTVTITNGTHYFIYFQFIQSTHHVTIKYWWKRDVAIKGIVPSKTIIGEKYSFHINVTIENEGSIAETFNVTLYTNDTIIESRTITLEYKTFTIIKFTWNTTGALKGNYKLWAYAQTLSNETDTADNILVDGWIKVTIPGDVDGDFDADNVDLSKIVSIYASKKSDLHFRPNSDVDGDGVITIFDVVICASHYGQKDQ